MIGTGEQTMVNRDSWLKKLLESRKTLTHVMGKAVPDIRVMIIGSQ
jgi:hypothetical protein